MSDSNWIKKFPKTPLQEKLQGKVYYHLPICSGDRRKPMGTPNCCCSCLGILRRSLLNRE